MQPLTAMTLAALALGAGAFCYDSATAQTAPDMSACATQEVSLYFEKGEDKLNDFSKAVAERIASEAKACGITEITAVTRVDAKRADAISRTFAAKGLNVALVGPLLQLASMRDTVEDRAASVRITTNSSVG